MKDKDTRLRWFRYTAEDAKAAQAELDELADGGWELAELGIFTATFHPSEEPRRCWVEPARWKSSSRKDGQAREDYLALCAQAGWDLLDEAGGLFYFQARPGTHPVPIQTDGSMEWEEVLKKSLWNQAYTFFYLVIYWVAWSAGRYFLDRPRLWEVFFSNGAMAAQLLLLVWVALELFLGLRVVRYRRKCRKAAETGAPMPVPGRRSARFRGAAPLCYVVLALGVGLSLLMSFSDSHTSFEGGERLTAGGSVLGQTAEYRRFSQEDGDLWIESYDCNTGWLAGIVCRDLGATEGDKDRLERYLHLHGPVELTPAELGYDQAWTYRWADGSGLLFLQGNRVVHMESAVLDLTDNALVSSLLADLDGAACALLESVIA